MSLTSPLPHPTELPAPRGTSPLSIREGNVVSHPQPDVIAKRLTVPAWLSEPERCERLRWLAGALEPHVEVRHAHLAAVRQVAPRGAAIEVVRDFVDGATLGERLRHVGPLACDEVILVASQIASAIDHLAKCGLSHGALTLDNVVVTPRGEVCVTDAGISAAASHSFAAASQQVRYTGNTRETDDIRALAQAICAMLAGVWDGNPAMLRGALYRLPTRARTAAERALDCGRAAFDMATPLTQMMDPVHRPSLWQFAWRPAAAVGVFAILATMPGSALPEQEAHRSTQARPSAAVQETRQAPPNGSSIVSALSADDIDVLRQAVRRLGPAVFARPAVADVFGLTAAQRQRIHAALDAHRQRVDQVVSSAATGTPIDTGAAMRDARVATSSSILRSLDDNQRAAWKAIAEDSQASSGGF